MAQKALAGGGSPRTERRDANWQITLLALWRLGGATERQHTEDVAVESWRLAPQRFSWQRHPEYPNLDTARVALSDAKKPKYGALVEGDNQSGWLLTSAGVSWAEANSQARDTFAESGTSLRRKFRGALANLRSTHVFSSWRGGRRDLDLIEIADAIDLPADAPRLVIIRRVDALLNAAKLSNDEETEEFLNWLTEKLGS